MGIKGLWALLENHVSLCKLTEVAMTDGFSHTSVCRYRVGVDANQWFYICTTSMTSGHANQGEHPKLRIFFSKLLRLSKLPVHLVFVFDGDQKPFIKRGVRVVKREHFLYKAMVSFIEAFGFEHHTAPADAEAELALMSSVGVIDAMITDDSDALLFGGRNIIRNWNINKDKDTVRMFDSRLLPFEQDDLILLGLLLGGDYDNNTGLRNCGPRVATALTRFGFSKSLCSAARTQSPEEFDVYLSEWHKEVQKFLHTDPNGSMGYKHHALAKSVPSNFPDPKIVHMYVSPLTSARAKIGGVASSFHPPDVVLITQLCELYFPWATAGSILEKFERVGVFRAILMAALTDMAAAQHGKSSGDNQVPPNFTINNSMFPKDRLAIDAQVRDLEGVRHRKLTYSIKYLSQLVLSSLKGIRQSGSGPAALDVPCSLTMWIPEAIIIAICASSTETNTPVTSHSFTSNPPASNPSAFNPPPSDAHTLSEDFGLNLTSLQQAFVTPTINALTLAALIEVFLSSNSPQVSMLVISAAFIKIIDDVSADDTSKLKLWCHYIKVIASLPRTTAQSLDTEVGATMNRQGTGNHPARQSVTGILRSYMATGMVNKLAKRVLEVRVSEMGSDKIAQSFDVYCAAEGVQLDTLLNFDD